MIDGYNVIQIRDNEYPIYGCYFSDNNIRHLNSIRYFVFNNIITDTTRIITDNDLHLNPQYYYAYYYTQSSTQLNTTSDYVYGKIFYGKEGVENGILTTNVSNSFADINAEVYAKIQQQYDNMQPIVLTDQDKTIDKNIYFIPTNKNGQVLLDISNVTNMRDLFAQCRNLTTIPLINTGSATNMVTMFAYSTNLIEIPQLDTSNVTTMYCMFNQCSNLVTVPQLNTSSLEDGVEYISTGMQNMFSGCVALSNESLNNILAMCTNATKLTVNKTLRYIGLTQAQATICQSLSNYSAFIAAGWTTGY